MNRENNTFLVTGTSSGIGRAIASRLLGRGAAVMGVSRRTDEWAWNDDGRKSKFQQIKCDLSKIAELERACKKIAGGRKPLRGIILAHGYGDFDSLEEFSRARIERLVATNLTSCIVLTKHLLPLMKKCGEGDLIAIGSEAARRGGGKGSVYCASKFGLRGFLQSIRKECASSGVRVSIINPGMVNTAFFDSLDFSHGESRDNYLEPEDIASAVDMILQMPKGSVVDEVNMSPQKFVLRNKAGKS